MRRPLTRDSRCFVGTRGTQRLRGRLVGGPVGEADAFEEGTRWLRRRVPAFAPVIDRTGVVRPPRRQPSAFCALARAITAQRISTAAADAIWRRTNALCPGPLTAAAVVDAGARALLAAGQSKAKVASLIDLATKAEQGELRLRALSRMSDDAVIAALVSVRGIGPWSAKMFLILHLHRVDVWPAGDLAVRKGHGLIFGHPPLDDVELERKSAAFAPYRSVAALYCWRAYEEALGRPLSF